MPKYIDLVCSGCDFSGTSTQIKNLSNFLRENGKIVKDLRGTEIDALFHTQIFEKINKNYFNFKEFLTDKSRSCWEITDTLSKINNLLSNLKVASFNSNEVTALIDSNSADAWIMEEPPKRGAGQVNRVIEQNRAAYHSDFNPIAAALSHQNYRTDEFLRFRQPLRDLGKIILRSRSEESACYQIFDLGYFRKGIKKDKYLSLPGHKIAFKNAPTHLFIVHGPENWTEKDYLKLKANRQGERVLDDHETNVPLQLLVNKRYATDWLENLYEEGCKMHKGKVPEIIRFDIYNSKEETKKQMNTEFKKILKQNKFL